jgi:outer membrane lipoprotein SlyB
VAAGGGGGGGRFGGGLLRPGSVAGQVTSASAGRLTVRTPAGLLTVKLDPATTVLKTATGRTADLATGARVVIASSASPDGSRVAQRVLLLPAVAGQGQG